MILTMPEIRNALVFKRHPCHHLVSELQIWCRGTCLTIQCRSNMYFYYWIIVNNGKLKALEPWMRWRCANKNNNEKGFLVSWCNVDVISIIISRGMVAERMFDILQYSLYIWGSVHWTMDERDTRRKLSIAWIRTAFCASMTTKHQTVAIKFL